MTLSERVVRWRLVPDGWQDGGFGLLWAVGGLPGRGRHRWWALDLRLGRCRAGALQMGGTPCASEGCAYICRQERRSW